MRVAVIGLGAVGARAARQLASTEEVDGVVVRDEHPGRGDVVAASLGRRGMGERPPYDAVPSVDVAIIATPPGAHAEQARQFLRQGAAVVSTSDAVADVRGLLDLQPEATERGLAVVAGAAFSPGLSCVLARHAAAGFDAVDEVHVARVGTGGPACARQHHRALGGTGVDWRDGGWQRRPGGSGRELCWFPDPIGAEDCYRAALPDGYLLVPAFPGVVRVTARLGANRRDRFSARLPMLRPPHPEGGPGAVRAEVRGRRGNGRVVQVLGAMDRPAVAAGAVAALAAVWAGTGRLTRVGAAGLAELVEPLPFLTELARRGVKAAVFEGLAAS
ncbi:hypothetical protein BH24ACT3_BH24ACT3_17140 [soil metagenome]